MSSKGERGKATSIAAFLFLPQFGRSVRSFSHVIPVFMRTLGIMFAQAGLIAHDHPAVRYGYPDVPRTGFADLIVSAYTTLRQKRGTPAQWATFLGVIMLCLTLAGGFAHAITVGGLGLGNAAKAQLYGLGPDANGTPRPTDATTMPTAAAGVAFDYTVKANCGTAANPCTGHDDFGIMLLDKVLRQGTHHMGGYLQNGMQAMMSVYNTGILVIAGFVLFWAVLRVVVDTAHTGVIGGGKHNMVWAPIRIVFALGLLMPLTTGTCATANQVCGFSSGQLMVEKLAEWGSNFGTNVWQAYLKAAVKESLLAPVVIDNGTPLMQSYANMWLCRVFYNAYSYESTGGVTGDAAAPNDSTVVRLRSVASNAFSTWSYSFTLQGKAQANLCGTVVVPNTMGDMAALNNYIAVNPNASFWQQAVQGFKDMVISGSPMGLLSKGNQPSWYMLFNDNDNHSGNCANCDTKAELVLDYWARAWACDFAMNSGPLTGQDPATGDIGLAAKSFSPLVRSSNCEANITETPIPPNSAVDINNQPYAQSGIDGLDLGSCTPGGPTGPNVNDPSGARPEKASAANAATMIGGNHYNCIQQMTNHYGQVITEAVSKAQVVLVAGFDAEVMNADRGWADMGSWYIKLTQVNKVLDWAKHPQVTIIPGSLIYTGLFREGVTAATSPAIDQQTMKVQSMASQWWQQLSSDAAVNAATVPINGCAGATAGGGMVACPGPPANFTAGTATRVAPTAIAVGSTEQSLQKVASGFLAPQGDASSMFLKGVMDFVSDKAPLWPMDILQPGANNVYPYTQLIQIGNDILAMGFAMAAGSGILAFFVQLLSSGLFGAVGGVFGTIITAASSTFILAGMLLSYWVPLLPFVRVAFSVMTWIVSVFVAVVMIPLAALNHISTEGEGLAGNARNAWILWLNILIRPALTVIGFVGGIMVFNGFIVYFNRAMASTVLANFSKGDGWSNLLDWVVMTVVYVGAMYVAANASFKLVDTVPAAGMQWMGGQHDENFADHAVLGGLVQQAGATMQKVTQGVADAGGQGGKSLREAMDAGRDRGKRGVTGKGKDDE